MERLFSEIYNRYFAVVSRLLSHRGKISTKLMGDTVKRYGFGESLLFLLPRLTANEWELFTGDNGTYTSKLPGGIRTPLSRLQKRWLKAVLNDPRSALFLDEDKRDALNGMLSDTDPLFTYDEFYYYDRFNDGDDYNDEKYRSHFRIILDAINGKHALCIGYSSRAGRNTRLKVIPQNLEYSVKNDCYRLLCSIKNGRHFKKGILRLSRMNSVSLCEDDELTESFSESPKKERVLLRIKDERNAMERAMLQFADYRKNTKRADDNSYLCEIFYDKDDETELLIEILSFGPMIQVIENEYFINLVKERLGKQFNLP